MSGMDDSDNTSTSPVDLILGIANHILPDGASNVEAAKRRGEELEAEAEQLRARGEQLAVRIEARKNEDSGNKK